MQLYLKTFNRTIVECKFIYRLIYKNRSAITFNRIIVECKSCSVHGEVLYNLLLIEP